MNLDSAGLQVLDRAECMVLLSSVPVGRIVFTDRALPAVQPVNFLVVENHIVIRTGRGSKLAAAARDAVVAFEADEFDAERWTGWSVTAIGQARAVVAPGEIERLSRLPLTAWAPGDRDHYIVMRIEEVSGRRIRDRVTRR
ncbi:Nitroimidazol reductase NimA, pyridoxamine 5'-phosphate oxidase superfamily [Sinosporangium album]|uniref:Nitroimidazol reductase NimA, pyridoxamine 5'-phosphate oxidase superfamily n=1 Tax=Sinosporangium album TaxID=504805 RepID=A0A1G8HQH8_9ACTN|nr:pyridoxamine 5'-phosphate oxidase family protein [Sinosporangium album]SDI08751.1 Nitroimidazol reductase NimA, pyridoxamine 5'-phosphate oxidase superfamily [Sinosporangium album]